MSGSSGTSGSRAHLPATVHALDARDEQLALKHERTRHVRTDEIEELALRLELDAPLVEIDAGRLVDASVFDVEARQIEIPRLRHPPEGRLLAADAKARAVDEPLQDAHVLA